MAQQSYPTHTAFSQSVHKLDTWKTKFDGGGAMGQTIVRIVWQKIANLRGYI